MSDYQVLLKTLLIGCIPLVSLAEEFETSTKLVGSVLVLLLVLPFLCAY